MPLSGAIIAVYDTVLRGIPLERIFLGIHLPEYQRPLSFTAHTAGGKYWFSIKLMLPRWLPEEHRGADTAPGTCLLCLKFSLIIVASVPVLMLYPFIQRYFVKGVMLGAIKG